MRELERELRELAVEVAFPPVPDVATRVTARLEREPTGGRSTRRRKLVVVLALLALALAGALAVPAARTAILELLRLRGATIERVGELPPAAAARLELGEPISLAEARRRLPFPVVLPAAAGRAPTVYYLPYPSGGQLGLALGTPERPLVFTAFRAEGLELATKLVGPGTRIEEVTIAGDRGVWLEGEPHAFVYRDAQGEIREAALRLAGNTLLWERGALTLRLEGARTKEEALRIARSVRNR